MSSTVLSTPTVAPCFFTSTFTPAVVFWPEAEWKQLRTQLPDVDDWDAHRTAVASGHPVHRATESTRDAG